MDWKNLYRKTEDLLQTYKNKAKLIATSALHCAAPCTAMGIPVILIAKKPREY
ncbi:polysaccharide pyruvyl transferase family protein [Campylobacter devanensis]|uniref:polysaccharide pyruvyl transferase family protein n=1 Tax=Campylobacter devanensis TaxID=3161138 RepID=UPI00112F7F38|nr:polysaccharide pyruvyl transferase family protein [Campylobacter sp. P0107]